MALHLAPIRKQRLSALLTGTTWALVLLLIVTLYKAIIWDLASEWWTESSASYGMLIPPVALYLAFIRRKTTLSIRPTPDMRGLWILALGCAVLLLGQLAAEFFLARVSSVVVLAGILWTVWGRDRVKTLLFPLLLLATMVPLPAIIYNSIAAPLQLFASGVATSLAQSLGVAIYRDGNIIYLANTSLGVAEACSGLHSLSAMVVASLLLGFLEEAALFGRVVVVCLAVPLAIAINVLRVTGTALLADYRLELAMGFYHALSGWFVFAFGFGVLWIAGKIILRRPVGNK